MIYYDKKNLIDIASNKIFEFIAKIKPNCIVHLAAHPGGLSNRFPIENVKINALGSIYIFEWCKQVVQLFMVALRLSLLMRNLH